jgi:hypothetical protein
VNCSRVPLEHQQSYRSLHIKGTNSSTKAMDYVIFAIYEKFKLDIVSGVFDKMDKKLN